LRSGLDQDRLPGQPSRLPPVRIGGHLELIKQCDLGLMRTCSGPDVQDSFPPNLSYRAHVHRSGLALPQPRRSGR
jgi:hypothetical protein